MSDKPSYLGLLNAIAVAEQRGHDVLAAWRDAATDESLKHVLNVVAIREQEHAAAFTKRLCELGFGLKPTPEGEFERSLALARSPVDDAEKFRKILGYGAPDHTAPEDPLAGIFDDHSIDPATGALLGRFIAEERDSERLLREAWQRLCPSSRPGDDSEAGVLAEIAERIDRLSRTLEELKELRH